jgi:hypothetical protein
LFAIRLRPRRQRSTCSHELLGGVLREQVKMYNDMYGDEKPAHVNQDFWHSDGLANHNRFKGVGMGNDFEPDGDAGFPAASFSARGARGRVRASTALAQEDDAVDAGADAVSEDSAPRKVVGSGTFGALFKKWVDTKLFGSKKEAKTAALASTAMSLEEEDEDEDDDETEELIFGFFILFLPLIVLVIVLLILLPFMIAKASGESQPSMPEMPGGEYAEKAQEHLKSTSDLVVKYLSPVEEMSPFKVGQIQKLISDVNEQAGTAVAPFFIVLQVLFLLAFVGYMVVAIVALCLDWEAMSCDCAADSWVWLYVLLALAIPTSFGFIMGLVKAGLALADLKKNVGWEIPDVFLALPAPCIYITLGILGIILWSTMDAECDEMYSVSYGMLFVIFKIQVIMLGIASIFGAITCFAQASVLIAQLSGGSGGSGDAQQETSESKYV